MTMSCPEVVYQAYYPYLYQRPGTSASTVARTTPFPPFSHQYDRFNVQRSLEHQQQPSSAPSLDVYHPHHSSHHSSAGSVSSGGGGVGSPGSPPVSALRHKDDDTNAGRSSGDGGHAGVDEDDDDEDDGPGTGAGGSRAQYVSANCVVFTHYSGDVAAVVDEHFSRALSYAADSKGASSTSSLKESSPMSARNFPPSFWNSNYQGSATVTSHHASAAELYGDPYHPHGAAGTGTDPWHSHYPQYSAAAHHHHRAVHEYHHHHNMAAQYGGLLLPPTTRLPPHVTASHQYSKSGVPEPWGAASHSARLHHEQAGAHHSHALESGYSAYPTMAGLEAQVQESSKDLYWF